MEEAKDIYHSKKRHMRVAMNASIVNTIILLLFLTYLLLVNNPQLAGTVNIIQAYILSILVAYALIYKPIRIFFTESLNIGILLTTVIIGLTLIDTLSNLKGFLTMYTAVASSNYIAGIIFMVLYFVVVICYFVVYECVVVFFF